MRSPLENHASARARTRLRAAIHWLVALRGTPEAIALGVGIGTFVAFTPTIGFQMLISAFLATIFGANRPAALVPSCITNPVTIPPVFAFNYWVGTWVWSGPPVTEVNRIMVRTAGRIARVELWGLGEQLVSLADLSRDVLAPLLIGSILVGIAAGVVSYAATLSLVRRVRRRWAGRRARADHAATP